MEQPKLLQSDSNLRCSARNITKNKSKNAYIYERFGKVAQIDLTESSNKRRTISLGKNEISIDDNFNNTINTSKNSQDSKRLLKSAVRELSKSLRSEKNSSIGRANSQKSFSRRKRSTENSIEGYANITLKSSMAAPDY